MKNHPANVSFITLAGITFSFLPLCYYSCHRKMYQWLAFNIGSLCFKSGTMITKYCVVCIIKKLLANEYTLNFIVIFCNMFASIAPSMNHFSK